MIMPLVASLVGSAVVLAVAAYGSRTKLGTGGVCWLVLGGTLFGLCGGSMVLALQCFLTFLLGLICLAIHARPRTVAITSAVAMLLSYLLTVGMAWNHLWELAQLRREYPLESVASKLSYEKQSRNEQQASDVTAQPPLSVAIDFRLSEFEERSNYNSRRYPLAQLHSSTYEQFLIANGFGLIRMAYVRRERIELPEAKPVPLPPKPKYDNYYNTNPDVPGRLADHKVIKTPAKEDLLAVHDSGLADFLKPDRMGYVKDRDHVAGFQPHQFSAVPEGTVEDNKVNDWQVTRLELISLLKHETPVAYVSKQLPRMDELQDAPTRPLNSFETQALDKLRYDEDVVIENDVNQIRMVGSIRASKSCTECHFVKRGELLGAFSYELMRKRPVPPPKPQEQPPQARWRPKPFDAFREGT